ncbi:MAG: hypothetical protein JXB29_05245 [Sedimentisphaerales bacterium]|nr:hypothetical protein [Sedimentisphaerales bacterium]
MAEKLVTIRHFCYGPDPASEAELARIKLETNGIRCFLAGKNIVSMYWLLSAADRGIKLQVRESDAKKALEILANVTHIDLDKAEDRDMKPEPINPACPKCGSNNVEYEGFSMKMFYIGILFFRFPLPFPKKKYKCMSCGEIWK